MLSLNHLIKLTLKLVFKLALTFLNKALWIYLLLFFRKNNKILKLYIKSFAWNFEQISLYLIWFLDSNFWERSKYFVHIYATNQNIMFRKYYLLDKKYSNFFLKYFMKYFWINFYLLRVFFLEGIFHNFLKIKSFIFIFFDYFKNSFRYIIFILKIFSIVLYVFFSFFWFNIFYIPKFFKNKMIEVLETIFIKSLVKSFSKPIRRPKFEKVEEILDEGIYDYYINNLEGVDLLSTKIWRRQGFKEKKDLFMLLEHGDRLAASELNRWRHIDNSTNYFIFILSYFFGFVWQQFFFFFILLPFEKMVSIFFVIFSIIKWPFTNYKLILNPAIFPLFLTNFFFFLFRFVWASILTMPIAYGYIWGVKYLKKIGWLKLHSHCWPWWVGYWRMLIIIRYTFRVPSFFYREPRPYSEFIHLPYSERKFWFKYYHRYFPYYGFTVCFIWFQTCMFWFPPTWSHKAVFLGPLRIF